VSRIVAVSPHLDDAVFSCGGTLARHAAQGHDVLLLTVFTASVPDPQGFALACQTDKGIGPEIDYMALRRAEDQAAAAALGLAGAIHAGLPEAPHRGYDDAAALFGELRDDDPAVGLATAVLQTALARIEPDLVLAPLGVGGHVDHVAVDRALDALELHGRLRWVDLPYAIRDPGAADAALDAAGAPPVLVPIGDALARKLDACAAYGSQLGFQFGDEAAMREALEDFAIRCATLADATEPVELLVGPPTGTVR
jgi:LmbE family N-acetylglucosaminyl deacetylase